MESDERAIPYTVSLYPKHIDIVKQFSRAKKFKYEAEGFQYIIEDFFNKDDKQVKQEFIIYLLAPLVFVILTTFVNIYTDKIYFNLLEHGIYYQDLHILSKVFMVLSFVSIGVFIACIYWLRKVRLVRHSEKGDIDGY